MADHQNDDGRPAFPSIDSISWKLGKHRRSVQRALSQLRATGLIKAVGSTRGERGHATAYVLTLLNGHHKAARQENLFAPDGYERAAPPQAKGGTHAAASPRNRVAPVSRKGGTGATPTPMNRTSTGANAPVSETSSTKANSNGHRAPDETFAAVVASKSWDLRTLTTDERGMANVAAKGLRSAGATGEQIEGFPAWWDQTFPDIPWARVKPTAMPRHWSDYLRAHAPPEPSMAERLGLVKPILTPREEAELARRGG